MPYDVNDDSDENGICSDQVKVFSADEGERTSSDNPNKLTERQNNVIDLSETEEKSENAQSYSTPNCSSRSDFSAASDISKQIAPIFDLWSKASIRSFILLIDADECWPNNLKENFEIVNFIAKGGYGKIFKVREKSTNLLYALKLIQKRKENKDEFDGVDEFQVLQEKRIFENLGNNPFLVKFHSSFETFDDVLLIMDYVDGITMSDYLKILPQRKLSENDAAFYIAETSVALHFLHKSGIIHKDLKIDNIMIDADGHIKVIDLGFAEDGLGFGCVTTTFLSTSFYVPPEFLYGLPYTFALDWFALGVNLCVMLTSHHPFTSNFNNDISKEEYADMVSAIVKKELKINGVISDEATSILECLLEPDPDLRLGSHDSDDRMEISEHAFLNKIDWTQLKEKKLKPPLVYKGTNFIEQLQLPASDQQTETPST